MKGIGIFTHAIGMVLGNIGAVLRISGLLMAFQFALVMGLGLQEMFLPVEPAPLPQGDPLGTAIPPGAPLLWLVQLFSGLWIAVAWHRFVLRTEVPVGIVPHFRGRAILRYLGVGLLYTLLLMVVAIPLAILAFFLIGPAALAGRGTLSPGPALVFAVLVWLPVVYLGLRLAPILAAAALEEKLPMREAWYQTGVSGSAFPVLAVSLLLAYTVVYLPLAFLAAASPVLAFVFAFLVQWAMLLIGASLIATLYGHYIEDRPLND